MVGKSTLTEALGHGERLPSGHRERFERSLGRDLSQVRVHTAEPAVRLTDLFGARAFASGTDIAFAPGEYKPHSPDGAHLLAHEVAHVAQQAGAAPPEALATTRPGDAAETGADAAASAMIAGRPAEVSAAPRSIARKTRDEPRAPAAPTASPAADVPADAAAQPAGDDIGELTATRVGQEVDEGPAPAFPVRSPETARRELAGLAGHLSHDAGAAHPGGEAEPGAAGVAAPAGDSHDAPGVAAPAGDSHDAPGAAATAGDGAAGSPATQQVQQDAREAAAAAEAGAAGYKAEVAAGRDRLEAEQHDTALAQLRTMSPADKRSTLTELGYDPRKVAQLRDAELDSLITGKLEAEQLKAKILGMSPEELAALSPEQKTRFLVDLGIDRADLDKAGPGKTARLFSDVTSAAHVPGSHKVKVQIKGGLFGKSWVVTVKCDSDGGVDVQAKKEGGFFSKLVGWIKAALPIVLTVLGPITGGATLIALSVYQTVSAIKSGNWLGAVIGAASALAGIGVLAKGASGLASALKQVGNVAQKVKKVAEAAESAMAAAKAKNAGSLLAALSQAAGAFAGAAGKSAGKFADTMKQWSDRLQKWGKIATSGQQVVTSIQHGDAMAAIGGAFATAAMAVGTGGRVGKDLQRAANLTRAINAGHKALQSHPPNYAGVAEAALGIAAQLHQDRRLDDAAKIVSSAHRLQTAWAARASNPAGVAEAAVQVAEAIQVARYDAGHAEVKGADGKPADDAARKELVERYERYARIVNLSGTLITAATTRPHPDVSGALDAASDLVGELTDDKRAAAAAALAVKIDAFRVAIASRNGEQIARAGAALAGAVNGLRKEIDDARAEVRRDAEAQLPAGEQLPTGGTAAPHPSSSSPAAGTGPSVVPAALVTAAPAAEATGAGAAAAQESTPADAASARDAASGQDAASANRSAAAPDSTSAQGPASDEDSADESASAPDPAPAASATPAPGPAPAPAATPSPTPAASPASTTPAPAPTPPSAATQPPSISGALIAGGPLSQADVDAIDAAVPSVPAQFRRYVAYADMIKVGGSISWRANNPGNLRDGASKIGTVHGAVGSFAVFPTMDAGRAAQRTLYLQRYGKMTVRAAIEKLTPRSENNTDAYLQRLAGAGVDLDQSVASQIDAMMAGVEANEGMIPGVEVPRAAAP